MASGSGGASGQNAFNCLFFITFGSFKSEVFFEEKNKNNSVTRYILGWRG